jgi:hypothetical protein
MKKSILMLLFVLISFVSNSQSAGITCKIDGASPITMDVYMPNSSSNTTNTLVTKYANSVIEFNLDAYISNPMIGATYTLYLVTPNTTIVTDTITSLTGNTFTFLAMPSTNSIYRLKISSLEPLRFYIENSNNKFGLLANTTVSNQVTFSWNDLPGSGPFQYALNTSSVQPTGNTTTINTLSKSYSITPADTGVKYFHIRGVDTTITGWYTYSVHLQYTAPTPTTNVSIAEIDNVTDFKLYPNPATDAITVQYSSKNNIDQVSLYTITGQEISTTAVESMGNNTLTFNVESYPTGIYFVRIGTTSYKFIKH